MPGFGPDSPRHRFDRSSVPNSASDANLALYIQSIYGGDRDFGGEDEYFQLFLYSDEDEEI